MRILKEAEEMLIQDYATTTLSGAFKEKLAEVIDSVIFEYELPMSAREITWGEANNGILPLTITFTDRFASVVVSFESADGLILVRDGKSIYFDIVVSFRSESVNRSADIIFDRDTPIHYLTGRILKISENLFKKLYDAVKTM